MPPDPVNPIEPAAAPPAAPAQEPAAPAAPVPAAPVVESAPPAAPIAPAVVEAPAPVALSDPGKAAEPAAPEPPAEPAVAPTLLEKADAERKAKEAADTATKAKPAEKPAEPKPAEPKPGEKAAQAKPAEAKPAEPAAPIEYKFELPDVLKPHEKRIGEFTAILGEGDVKVPADKAQKLLNLHADAMTEFAQATADQSRRDQIEAFNKTTAAWEKLVLADDEFGGAGYKTAEAAVARTRDALISSAPHGTPKYQADLASFEEFIRYTGAGSHPAFWRILHNAARFIDEPQARELPSEIRPAKGQGRAPRGGLYTHPSSANMDQQ